MARIWFAIQAVLAAALVAAPIVSRAEWPIAVRAVGGVLCMGGALALASAYRALGASHSPWIAPAAGAELVTRGPYAIVRHPIYAAFVAIALGVALAFASPIALAIAAAIFVYYDARTRAEERALTARHPGYADYARRVRGRLVPGIY